MVNASFVFGMDGDDASVFDDEYPGIARLDADLLHALRVAGSQAIDDGIALYVNSGWRSADYQNELLRAAVSEYGSEKEAAKMGRHSGDVPPRVRRRGRRGWGRCNGVAVGARRCVRPVPDLPQ